MNKKYLDFLSSELNKLKEQGLYKTERIMASPQGASVLVNGQKVLNMCANNYLGLANHPDLVKAAQEGLAQRGFGMSSVRFICGTQDIHKELEAQLSAFLGMEDTQLYGSCFDANGGVFEALLGEDDAVISDALNHASIIDGVRLCKAKRFRYANSDMADLEVQLKAADDAGARFKLVVTDGVFSMDGYLANLPGVCDLAERYGAMVMVDDSHAVGFIGENGRGTHEHHDVMGRVDILTGTLGKALGGASGGYIASSQPVVDMLRQKSRPYLFSNTLAPSIVATSLKVLAMLREGRRPAQAAAGQRPAVPHRHGAAGLQAAPGRAPDHPGDVLRRAAGPGLRRGPAGRRASTSPASSSRWCPRARPASAPRCPPPTRPPTSPPPSRHLPRWAAPWA